MHYLLTILPLLPPYNYKSPTCKLKTFHEEKALISFKFANKDSINRKTSRKFSMHYVNTTCAFWGNSLLEKGKYLVLESSHFCVE